MRGTRAGGSTSLEKGQLDMQWDVLRTCLPCAWAAFQRRGGNGDVLGQGRRPSSWSLQSPSNLARSSPQAVQELSQRRGLKEP